MAQSRGNCVNGESEDIAPEYFTPRRAIYSVEQVRISSYRIPVTEQVWLFFNKMATGIKYKEASPILCPHHDPLFLLYTLCK